MKTKSNKKDIRDACLWLIKNTNIRLNAIAAFFNLHPNTLSLWQKRIYETNEKVPKDKNKYVVSFLGSEYNSPKFTKANMLDVDLVQEVKYVVKNSVFTQKVIARYYNLAEQYISQINTNYVWENVEPVKPINYNNIIFKLSNIEKEMKEELEVLKGAASWLLLYTNLDLTYISKMLKLSYFIIYRLYITKKSNKDILYKLSNHIKDIKYSYDIYTNIYDYKIIYYI